MRGGRVSGYRSHIKRRYHCAFSWPAAASFVRGRPAGRGGVVHWRIYETCKPQTDASRDRSNHWRVSLRAHTAVRFCPRPRRGSLADIVLTNGKVITVDEKFSIAQAVAIRGDRILAVGTNQQINALAGPSTRRIDLRGRALMPGFIDNHAHYQEEGAYWTLEDRLDGVTTRKQAIEILRARAKLKGPGKWIFTLGGWAPDVFTDDPRPFTREELDKILPDNPVFLQFSREAYYLNSKAIEATGMEKMTDAEIRRDASGRATGIVDGDRVGGILRNATGVLKNIPKEIFESSSMQMLKDFAAAGLTASAGACQYENEYRQWLREGKAVSMRFFCFRTSTGQGRNTDQVIAEIPKLRYFDGDEWIDHVNWGERLVNVPDNVYDTKPTVPAATWNEWGRMAKAVAQAGIPVMIHTTQEWTIEEQLKQIEAFASEVPVRGKRWTFMHMEQVTPNQLERMRKLGMWVAIHPAWRHRRRSVCTTLRRARLCHAQPQVGPGQRNPLGLRHGCIRGEPVQAVHDARVGRHRQIARRRRRQGHDEVPDQQGRCAGGPHPQQRVLPQS